MFMTKPTTQTDPGPNTAETQFYRQALHDLIDIGADLARKLDAQATAQAGQQAKVKPVRLVTDAPPAPPPVPDALIRIAADFDRVASAVRRSIMLAQSLDEPAKQPALNPVQGPDRAASRTQPGPVRAAKGLPEDPAEAIGTVLRHHARWRLPPES